MMDAIKDPMALFTDEAASSSPPLSIKGFNLYIVKTADIIVKIVIIQTI
jgi:hypothetical protein